jgi:hypothetical protein
MTTGVQFIGSLAANQTQRWFTFNWPAVWHVVWYMVPTSAQTVPEVNWSVAVERQDANYCTYFLTVTNLTGTAVNFEGRYAILA